MVFLIDLPRLGAAPKAQPTSPFCRELQRFLLAQGLDEGIVRSLDNYDFSRAVPYSFVHTMFVIPSAQSDIGNDFEANPLLGSGGSHIGEPQQHTGSVA
jgi:hypothetical protein